MQTERELIGQLKQGHHNALSQLMSKYQNYVYTILISMLHVHEAQEATQDTFIKIFQNINKYNGQSKLSTWMYSIAYRTGLDYIKKRKNYQPIEESNYNSKADMQADLMENEDISNWLNYEIKRLDTQDAALIRLYYLNEYSIQEVAEITGLSPSNIKVKLFRTRNLLRERMSHMKLSDLLN